MTAKEVQYALTYSTNSPFYFRSHYVVPNVKWGLDFRHELDLLSISKNYIGTEVEIKVSKADLKRDLLKEHGHYDPRIRQLYFAGPLELLEAFKEFVPEEAGIITVKYVPAETFEHRRTGRYVREGYYHCQVHRKAKISKNYRKPFTKEEVSRLMRLGNLRYWSLFSKQIKQGGNMPAYREKETWSKKVIVKMVPPDNCEGETREFPGTVYLFKDKETQKVLESGVKLEVENDEDFEWIKAAHGYKYSVILKDEEK
jgi:hypothetical protein